MKKHTTLKSKFNSAFSLVELLVVIAVIAIIAAIAIPNISGITGSATTAANQRNAQNLASLSAAVRAAGDTNSYASKTSWVSALISTSGITVTNIGGQTLGPFKAEGMPTNTATLNAIYAYLSFSGATNSSVLVYNPAGGDTNN
jgi:type IV pilus assembly protein PilA